MVSSSSTTRIRGRSVATRQAGLRVPARNVPRRRLGNHGTAGEPYRLAALVGFMPFGTVSLTRTTAALVPNLGDSFDAQRVAPGPVARRGGGNMDYRVSCRRCDLVLVSSTDKLRDDDVDLVLLHCQVV